MANQLGPGPLYAKPDLIAREMFPRELVEAAKALLLQVELKCKVQGSEGHFARDAERARFALALYPEPEEPAHD